MADYTYKICSKVGYKSEIERCQYQFWIEERKSFTRKWHFICGGHEKFEDGKVEFIKFKDYDDAEKYLIAKYSRGYAFEKDGNIYNLYLPNYYV